MIQNMEENAKSKDDPHLRCLILHRSRLVGIQRSLNACTGATLDVSDATNTRHKPDRDFAEQGSLVNIEDSIRCATVNPHQH